MKKILSILLISVLLLFSSIQVFASETENINKVQYYEGISNTEIREADVLSIDYSNIKAISEKAKGIVDAGTMIYIVNPEVSAEDISNILSIPKTNTTSYQKLLLVGYSIYKLDDKYVFGNHYAIFADETGEKSLDKANYSEPEVTAPLKQVKNNFSNVQTMSDYEINHAKNIAISEANTINSAFAQKIETIEKAKNIKPASVQGAESVSFPSKIAAATWNDTLNVYDSNNKYYGYVNCTVYGYIIGTGKINGTTHDIYDVLAYCKAYPQPSYAVRKYKTTIKANYTDFRSLQTSPLTSGISYSQSVGLSSTVGLSDVNISGSLSTSWTYNPESQIITESSSQPRVVSWTAEPASLIKGKAFGVMPGMRIASPTKYSRAGFAEFNCNSYFIFGITTNENTIPVGGWF